MPWFWASLSGNKGKLNPTGTAQRAELAFRSSRALTRWFPIYTDNSWSPSPGGSGRHPRLMTSSLPSPCPPPPPRTLSPGVVMLHGTGSNCEAGNGYAMPPCDVLTQARQFIRIDFTGNGESKADYVNYNNTSP